MDEREIRLECKISIFLSVHITAGARLVVFIVFFKYDIKSFVCMIISMFFYGAVLIRRIGLELGGWHILPEAHGV